MTVYFDFVRIWQGLSSMRSNRKYCEYQATGLINKLYTALLDHNMDWINNPKAEYELNLFVMRLLFVFFGQAQLQTEIKDRFGKKVQPKE